VFWVNASQLVYRWFKETCRLSIVFAPAVSSFLALASLLALTGVAQQPQSRLSTQERQQVEAIGKSIDASMVSGGTTTEVGSVKDVVLPASDGSVSVRIYKPVKAASRGTVLFIHGGAFIGGSVQSHDNMARLICSTSEANVVSVEYTRPPAAMHPTQLNQVRSVMEWLGREGKKEGLSAQPLAVCGDSAGGNMSAVLARESKAVTFAALINPVIDLTAATVTDQEVRFFTDLMVKAYVPKETDLKDPSLSPLLSDVPKGHPATFIAIGDKDPWRAEQDLYAEKLKKAGVSVEVFRSATGHLGPDGALATKTATSTLIAAGKAIKSAFGR